jgi:hypothetical protein
MIRMIRLAVPIVIATALLGVPGTAGAQLLGTSGAVGVIAATPGGDFTQGNGVGLYAKLEAKAVLVGVAAEVNAVRFGAKEFPDGGSTEGETIFSAFVGPRIPFLIGSAGVDVGLSTQSDGFAWGPAFTLAFGPVEVGATVTFAEFGRWFGLRGGIRF